jgi:hypothetical protein
MMWLQALAFCCKSGFDIQTLLKIRQLSSQVKKIVDEALGNLLSSNQVPWSSSFWGPPPGAITSTPVAICNRLRRLCGALGRPLTSFTLSYNMILDCRRRSKIITALPLSYLVELCNIGVNVRLTIRVVSGPGGVNRAWLSKIASLRNGAPLFCLTELHISGREAATTRIMEWLMRCGVPQLNRLTYVALTTGLLRSSEYAPILINKLFSDLPMLTDLSLSRNALSGRSLQVLNVFTRLTKLDISANPLYHDELHYLVAVLGALTQLRELNMSSNHFINGLAGVARAVPKTVTNLDLSLNQLGLEAARESLADLVLPSLTRLNLSSNGLGVKGASMLPVSLLTSLSLLDLSHNGILEESQSWTPAVPWLTCFTGIDGIEFKNGGICLL